MKRTTHYTSILYTCSYILLSLSLLTVLYTSSFDQQFSKYSFIEQEESLLLTYKEEYINIRKRDEILYYDKHTIYQDTITQMNHPKYQIHLEDSYILPSNYIGTILYKVPFFFSFSLINTLLTLLILPPLFLLVFFIKKRYSKRV